MPATLEAPVKPFVNDGVVNDPCCMGKTLDHVSFIINLASYTLQLKKFEGKDHIVVPVIMLTEGVHNGSDGPVFYPAEEISKFLLRGMECLFLYTIRKQQVSPLVPIPLKCWKRIAWVEFFLLRPLKTGRS